jgi:putative peptidoglycan lipid II flippase
VAGALLGAAVQVAIQWVSLRRAGWAGPAIVDLRDPTVRDIGRRIAPIGLGALVYAIDLILSRRFLSDFGPGAQSWFTWAMRLCDFPAQMFALAVSAVAATSLAKLASKHADLAKATSISMRLTLFFSVPVSVALVLLAHPIVVLVFERGELDSSSSWETSRALVWQASVIWAAATSRHLVSLLYALRATRTPLVAAALDVVVFVAIVLALRGTMGHVAVSVAVAGAGLAQMTILFVWAKRKLPALGVLAIVASGLRTLVAAIVAAVAAWSTALLLAPPSDAGGLARALPGVAAIVAFAAMYLGAAWSLRSPELAAVFETMRRRRRKA